MAKNIEECEVLKFLALTHVESVFAHDEADNYLKEAKEMAKPKDHGEVSDA